MLNGTSTSHRLPLRCMDHCGRKGKNILRPRSGRCLQQNKTSQLYLCIPSNWEREQKICTKIKSAKKISAWRRSSPSPSLSCEAIHKWLLLKERGSFLSGCSPWKSTHAPLCVYISMYIEAATSGLCCMEIIKFIPASSMTPTRGSCRGQF